MTPPVKGIARHYLDFWYTLPVVGV
jgi:hypothetical protein